MVTDWCSLLTQNKTAPWLFVAAHTDLGLSAFHIFVIFVGDFIV